MIAIKGMKMPKNCSDCDFCHGHICKRTGIDIIANPKGNCPIVEIANCKECAHYYKGGALCSNINCPEYRLVLERQKAKGERKKVR